MLQQCYVLTDVTYARIGYVSIRIINKNYQIYLFLTQFLFTTDILQHGGMVLYSVL